MYSSIMFSWCEIGSEFESWVLRIGNDKKTIFPSAIFYDWSHLVITTYTWGFLYLLFDFATIIIASCKMDWQFALRYILVFWIASFVSIRSNVLLHITPISNIICKEYKTSNRMKLKWKLKVLQILQDSCSKMQYCNRTIFHINVFLL